MRKKMALSVVAIAMAMLLSFGAALDQANADALLFPWIVKSGAISSLVSVVNTAAVNPLVPPFAGVPQLHWSYYYKDDGSGGVNNSQTAMCVDLDFKMDTSLMDVVTVDAAGNINGGIPMWGDTNNALSGGVSASITAPGDRRAFLIVDNNTPVLSLPTQLNNVDGTLYGEAMILEIASGAAWGYVAYNSAGPFADSALSNPLVPPCAGGQNGFVSFSNGLDPHGEVIGNFFAVNNLPPPINDTVTLVSGELAPVVLMPPTDVLSKFFMTPVDMISAAFAYAAPPPIPGDIGNCGQSQFANTGQRAGNINSRVGVCSYPGLCQNAGGALGLPICVAPCASMSGICLSGTCASAGITLNDELPLSSTKLKNIVCTSADDISAMLDSGTMVSWVSNGGQAWTYMRTTFGNMQPAALYQYTPNMMIGKLEWADGGTTIDGRFVGGTFNNFIQVRNNKDNLLTGPNGVPFGINNLVPLPQF